MSAIVSPDSTVGSSVATSPASNIAGLNRGHADALRAILLAGAAAATFDLAFAFTFYGATLGASPIRILHSIASGAFGLAAFDGGIATAAFGLLAHYFILIVAASLFHVASTRVTVLRRRAAICGPLFGVAIYCVMHYVVLPLSAAPKFRTSTLSIGSEFVMHLLLGLTIALVLRAGWTRLPDSSGRR
jgi:uncharacterized membrane protein YagU involved in acid resistance